MKDMMLSKADHHAFATDEVDSEIDAARRQQQKRNAVAADLESCINSAKKARVLNSHFKLPDSHPKQIQKLAACGSTFRCLANGYILLDKIKESPPGTVLALFSECVPTQTHWTPGLPCSGHAGSAHRGSVLVCVNDGRVRLRKLLPVELLFMKFWPASAFNPSMPPNQSSVSQALRHTCSLPMIFASLLSAATTAA